MTHAIRRRKRSALARFSYNFLHDCTTVLEPGTGYVTPSHRKKYMFIIFSVILLTFHPLGKEAAMFTQIKTTYDL